MSNTHVDLIGQNGGGQGPLAQNLSSGRLDVGAMRPFIAEDGNSYVTVYQGGNPKKAESWKMMQVNSGTLRRDEWRQLDEALLGIAEKRLSGTQALVSRGLTYSLGNA